MIVGYCILNGKKWVMFKDKQCAAGEVKLTDGFKDKLVRRDSDKLAEMGFSVRYEDERLTTAMAQRALLEGDASRKRRIAAGSGTTVQDVNQLIRQFEDMKKQMKMVMNQARGKKGRFRFPPMR